MTNQRTRANTPALSRRNLLMSLPALACAPVASVAMTATPHDPLPEWFADWTKWRKVELDLSETPEGGNFDMPEQLAAADRYDKLSEQIAHAKPTTAAGVAAQLEWLEVDSFGLGGIDHMNVQALHNAIAALRAGVF